MLNYGSWIRRELRFSQGSVEEYRLFQALTIETKGKTKPEKGISRHPYNPTRTEGYSHKCPYLLHVSCQLTVNQATTSPEPIDR